MITVGFMALRMERGDEEFEILQSKILGILVIGSLPLAFYVD